MTLKRRLEQGRSTRRRSSSYGQWELIADKPLGAGGNGQVWTVRHKTSGVIAALKLHKGGRASSVYRTERFKREIKFLLDHPEFPGVLPLVDYDLRVEQGPPWYVMPLARTMREALGEESDPREVVVAIAAIADTLRKLALEGVWHRDIKPDNLFERGGCWLVGDFGLVTRPNTLPLTEAGRKLGPTDFLAPEMRRNPDVADAEKADVYSLAKTLWALLANTELPLPGQHRIDDEICSLSIRISYKYSRELDALIERCTANDPVKRPSMEEVFVELNSIVGESSDRASVSVDVRAVQERLSVIVNGELRKAKRRDWHQQGLGTATHLLSERVLKPAEVHLSNLVPACEVGYGAMGTSCAERLLQEKRGMNVWSASRPELHCTMLQAEYPAIVISTMCALPDGDVDIIVVTASVEVRIPPVTALPDKPLLLELFEARAHSADLAKKIEVLGSQVERMLPTLLSAYLGAVEEFDHARQGQ